MPTLFHPSAFAFIRVVRGLLLGFGFATALSPLAFAHPIHTSTAEAEYRAERGKLEIALRLFTDDAEAALSKHSGKTIIVAKTPPADFDAVLLAYLRAYFIVKAADGTAQQLTWVGRELKDADQHLWVYLECPLPGGLHGARFANKLLREEFSSQINSLLLRDPGPPPRRATLLFTSDAEQRVAMPK